ncbi:helix-turn-helix transcriptional regulator [Pseudaestuariivita sp.]|uniref:helix-turn-helix transcriptional regulator n=1 Tax=Pseudaestuariivita sp. TaxID=2211669 RepID=UPI0040596E04
MSRTARLFHLMQTIRSLPAPVTGEALGRALDVSPRTIYRDVDTLRGLGAVIDGEAGYGFTLVEDNAVPPQSFTDDELEALVLGLREVEVTAEPVLAAAAGKALSKLQARLPDRQAHRLKHAVLHARRYVPIPQPQVDTAALRQAAWDERRVRFAYTDAEGNTSEREVDPLSIVHFDATHCLVAWCHLRDDYRTFRLDRLRDLEVTEVSFRPNRVPMLRTYMERLAEHC